MSNMDNELKNSIKEFLGREAPSTDHPSPDDLYSFRKGELEETRLHDEIMEHLSRCKACFDELATIADHIDGEEAEVEVGRRELKRSTVAFGKRIREELKTEKQPFHLFLWNNATVLRTAFVTTSALALTFLVFMVKEPADGIKANPHLSLLSQTRSESVVSTSKGEDLELVFRIPVKLDRTSPFEILLSESFEDSAKIKKTIWRGEITIEPRGQFVSVYIPEKHLKPGYHLLQVFPSGSKEEVFTSKFRLDIIEPTTRR